MVVLDSLNGIMNAMRRRISTWHCTSDGSSTKGVGRDGASPHGLIWSMGGPVEGATSPTPCTDARFGRAGREEAVSLIKKGAATTETPSRSDVEGVRDVEPCRLRGVRVSAEGAADTCPRRTAG